MRSAASDAPPARGPVGGTIDVMGGFGEPVRDTVLRAAIVDAARRTTSSDGWSAVTMSRLAADVGVSRQSVYNEVGSKPELAQALVLDELGRFMALVELGFDAHPRDVRAAVEAAVRGVLDFADDNALIAAIVAGTHGADTDLLPLLTTSSLPLLDVARAVVARRLAAYCDDEARVAATTDVLGRVTLSHVMQPGDTPARTASNLADAVERLLA